MKKILTIISFLFFISTSYGFDVSSLGAIDSYVIDKSGVLSDTDKQEIVSETQKLRDKYKVQILTVLLNTTEDEVISDVGFQIGQEVGVGEADKDNGIVILIAIDDRAWNISTGYGVEGILPDLLTNQIGTKNFILFRDEKYKQGIVGALLDFDKALSGDYEVEPERSLAHYPAPGAPFIVILIYFVIASFISSIYFVPFLKKKDYKGLGSIFFIVYAFSIPIAYFLFTGAFFFLKNLIIWILSTLLSLIGSSSGGSGGGGSGGGSSYKSSSRSWSSSSRSSSSSSSSFGGYGGGSFGGGGSSGKW